MVPGDSVDVFIEVSAGSAECRKFNEETLEYRYSRHSGIPYIYAYGFIIGTRTDDGDAVDCYVLTRRPLQSGTTISCRPVGLLKMLEDGEVDDKVLAVLPEEDRVVDETLKQELHDFITALFSGHPDIDIRLGDVLPVEEAVGFINRSVRS